jgi:hypothetical protein
MTITTWQFTGVLAQLLLQVILLALPYVIGFIVLVKLGGYLGRIIRNLGYKEKAKEVAKAKSEDKRLGLVLDIHTDERLPHNNRLAARRYLLHLLRTDSL